MSPDQIHLDKLNKYVQHELDDIAKKTHVSMKELMEIMEEVNVIKLHEAAREALRKIAHATDLTPAQIEEIFTHHRGAPLEDICGRLVEKSMVNRSKF